MCVRLILLMFMLQSIYFGDNSWLESEVTNRFLFPFSQPDLARLAVTAVPSIVIQTFLDALHAVCVEITIQFT